MVCEIKVGLIVAGRVKMRGMKMRHQMTGVENARKVAMERLHDLR